MIKEKLEVRTEELRKFKNLEKPKKLEKLELKKLKELKVERLEIKRIVKKSNKLANDSNVNWRIESKKTYS